MLTVADFNRDGKLDVAVADNNINKITILLGDGAGGLTEAAGSPISVGSDPESLTTGDFNHDGKLDIAVANALGGNVSIILGNGSGGFAPAVGSPFAAAANPASIIAADFNLDGNLDLGVANIGSKTVTVLANDGSAGFAPAAGSPVVGTNFSGSLTVGDFNRDGKPDLVVVNGNAGATIDLNGCTTSVPTPTPTPTATPVPNLVQFNLSSVNVTEACTSVSITVNRSGDTSTPATVDYATSDGTATERGDYITARGTLNFAAGDTAKTITVLINDDSFVEGNENFSVNLSNPTGFNLGTAATATITIVDNPSEPNPNVIDNAQDFVCQHYHDFLGRQPDQSGWDFWTNQITSCGTDTTCIQNARVNVSAAFFLSIEFQKTGSLVERVYKTAFGDATGSSSLGGNHQMPVPFVRYHQFVADSQRIARGVVVTQSGWDTVLETNTQAFITEFMQRPAFGAAFPTSMTPAQYVDKINANAGNPLSQSERDQLVADLTNHVKTAAQALRAVAERQPGQQ